VADQSAGYLVSYGRSGFIGRFDWPGNADGASQPFARGQRVLLRTARGLELGTVLEPLTAISEPLFPASEAGLLVGPVTAADEQRAAQSAAFAAELFESAASLIESLGLPLALVEVEPNLDATLAVLHVLSWGEYDPAALLGTLTLRYGCELLWLDESRFDEVARAVTAAGSDHGCGAGGSCSRGAGGCGSAGECGSGCGSGSCSRGAIKTARELTEYFSQLRERMQRDSQRLPLR